MSSLTAQAVVLPVSAPAPAKGVAADGGRPAERDAADFNAVLAGRLAGKDAGMNGKGPAPAASALASDEVPAEAPAETAAPADATDAGVLLSLITAQIAAPSAPPETTTPALATGSQLPRGAASADAVVLAAPSGTAGIGPCAAAPAPGTPVADASATAKRQDPPGFAAPAEPPAGNASPAGLPPAVPAAATRQTAEVAVDPAAGGIEPTAPAAESSPLHHGPGVQRSAAADAGPAVRVETPVTAPRWGEEVAQKVVWLAGRNESRAELVLTPPQLGKVEISLSVSPSGETSASFVSPSPQVREVLEQSMARLREVFAAAGISLGQTSVSGEAPARDPRGEGRSGNRGRADPLAPAALPAAAARIPQQRGLVDTFA